MIWAQRDGARQICHDCLSVAQLIMRYGPVEQRTDSRTVVFACQRAVVIREREFEFAPTNPRIGAGAIAAQAIGC